MGMAIATGPRPSRLRATRDIAPGHDAWVVGDESCVAVDFGGYARYAAAN